MTLRLETIVEQRNKKKINLGSRRPGLLKRGAVTSLWRAVLISMSFVAGFGPALAYSGEGTSRVVLVDKKKYQAHVAEYRDGELRILKTYHSTLGKNLGDKVQTDDKKTPEGIYFFTAKRQPPQLPKKFGVMAFPVDYPNPLDRMENKTGFGIMLHATDDPPRLQRNLDSDGCVVVDNHEIEEISPQLRLGLSALVIYDELKPEYLKESSNGALVSFFQKWLQAWESKDLEAYIGAYHDQFRYNGMNLQAYKQFKGSLNRKYARIQIKSDHVRFYQHPKYHVISFGQDYQSFNDRGVPAFTSRGTKFLYVKTVAGQDGKNTFKIVYEDFSHLRESDRPLTAASP